jgi:hypothetical protein
VEGPLLEAADWRGITFGTVKSQGQTEAIRALGATPQEVFRRSRKEALSAGKIQGFEMSLLIYQKDGQARPAPYVTANVNLWPQMDVLVSNTRRLAELSEQQRGWLEEAARNAAERSVNLVDQDAENLQKACQLGARFANASKEDLAALREAFVPVYTDMEQDAQTKAFIQQIQELKQSAPADVPLAIPAGCGGKAPTRADAKSATASAELNGTYRYTLTKEDARRFNDEEIDLFPHTNTVKLQNGKVSGGCFGEDAAYSLTGNQINFNPEWDPSTTLSFTYTVDGKGNLHLTPVQPMDPGDWLECGYRPWIKIG